MGHFSMEISGPPGSVLSGNQQFRKQDALMAVLTLDEATHRTPRGSSYWTLTPLRHAGNPALVKCAGVFTQPPPNSVVRNVRFMAIRQSQSMVLPVHGRACARRHNLSSNAPACRP